jgi:DNA-binding transcriptional LysR family regulator
MAVSPQFDSSISVPPRQRRSVSRLAQIASSLWYLARLAAIAGLLASGLGVGATTGFAVAAQSAGLAGQLLVARPDLRDPRFSRTVVYVVHHDAGGAMGLILNRPIGEASLSELLEQAGVEGKSVNGKIRVHFGGPVGTPRGFVLHTADYKIDGTQVIKDGIAVTA